MTHAVVVTPCNGTPTMSVSDVDRVEDDRSDVRGPETVVAAVVEALWVPLTLREEPPTADRRPAVGPR